MAKLKEAFAENLLKYRKIKGFSQEELGRLIDVTRQTINGYEKAVGHFSLDTLSKLADALGIEETDLIADPKHLMEIAQARGALNAIFAVNNDIGLPPTTQTYMFQASMEASRVFNETGLLPTFEKEPHLKEIIEVPGIESTLPRHKQRVVPEGDPLFDRLLAIWSRLNKKQRRFLAKLIKDFSRMAPRGRSDSTDNVDSPITKHNKGRR